MLRLLETFKLEELTQAICGEARIVERAFGVGTSALAETVAVIGEQLEFQPA